MVLYLIDLVDTNRKILDKVPSAYGIKPISYKKTTKGFVNYSWIVKTKGKKYILQKVRFLKLKEIKFELEYLVYLKRHNFPYSIPAPMSSSDGKLVLKIDGSYFWLYEYIEGHYKKKLGRSELKEIAKMLATYHSLVEKASMKWKMEKDTVRMHKIWRSLGTLGSEVAAKPMHKADKIFVEKTAELILLSKRLDFRGYSKFNRYPLHRDIGRRNLLWRGEKLVGILDFENVGTVAETIMKDIAVLFEYQCRDKERNLDLRLAGFFLHEYCIKHPLSEEQIRFISTLIIAGHIEDFDFDYWRIKNDPKRSKLSDMTFDAEAAQWCYKNKERIDGALIKAAMI